MKVAKEAALLRLEIVDVVNQAKKGLQADEGNEDYSQARVSLVKELKGRKKSVWKSGMVHVMRE